MKSVLITGASGGVGKAMIHYFLRQNWFVIASDKDCEGLYEFCEHGNFRSICIDVTDPQSIKDALTEVNSLVSALDGLVNNAGVFEHFPLAEGGPDQFEKLISVNVLGAVRMTRACFPLIRAAGGRIVNISSETAMASLPMQAYGVSKRMLEVYTDAVRQELDLIGHRVILIRAGAHATGLLNQSRDRLENVAIDSAFHTVLEIVRNKGQAIIDRGASDPVDIASAVFTSLTTKKPRQIYHVNVSARFKILQLIPKRLKEYLVRRILMRSD